MIQSAEKFDGQVLELTFGPAPANILNEVLIAELTSTIRQAQKNPHTKLIILSGEGKHFSYGASVEEHAPIVVNKMLPGFHKMISDVLACPIPTMAKIRGLCLGGGFELAMACTYLYAEDTSQMGIPEIQLGVFPPVAAALLPFLIGNRASEMILSGAKYKATQLLDYGLLHTVVPGTELDAAVSKFVDTHVLPKSASSLRMAHQATRHSINTEYKKHIPTLEKLYLENLMSTKDAVEGIQSFLEKRNAKWMDA